MITLIASDLDGTLYSYKNGYEGIFRLFEKYGVQEKLVKKAYEEIRDTGFSIEELCLRIKNQYSVNINTESVKKEFRSFLKKSLCLYPDVLPFLQENKSLPFVIVSFGHPGFQKQKVDLLGLKPRELITTGKRNDKASSLLALVAEYGSTVLYIDDQLSELDSIAKAMPDQKRIKTVWIQREDGTSSRKLRNHPHVVVNSFKEVSTLLRKQSSLE